MKRYFKIILLGIGITYLSFYGILDMDVPSSAEAATTAKSDQEKAPDFKLKDINGKEVKLSDFKGKIVILDFWATWCPPCKMEIPHFIELQKTYEKQGATIVGIALDEEGSTVVKPFYQKNKLNYPVLIGNQELTETYGGIRGIPTTFVIDQNGNIYQKYVGYRDKEVFEKDIKTLLVKDKKK